MKVYKPKTYLTFCSFVNEKSWTHNFSHPLNQCYFSKLLVGLNPLYFSSSLLSPLLGYFIILNVQIKLRCHLLPFNTKHTLNFHFILLLGRLL